MGTLSQTTMILSKYPAVIQAGIANPRWRGKRSRHSRHMRNPQFYVSGKRPIGRWFSVSKSRVMNWAFIRLKGSYLGLNYNPVIDWIRRIYAIATTIHTRWPGNNGGLLATRHYACDSLRDVVHLGHARLCSEARGLCRELRTGFWLLTLVP